MRLTRFTDYSLRVLMAVALRPGQRVTIGELAQALDLPANHLSKVVRFLGQRGWVATTRGKGGGMTLGLPAAAINLGEVVLAAEGPAEPAECFEAGGAARCNLAPSCRLHGLLAEAADAFHEVLDRHTLQDLMLGGERMHQVRFPDPYRRPDRPADAGRPATQRQP